MLVCKCRIIDWLLPSFLWHQGYCRLCRQPTACAVFCSLLFHCMGLYTTTGNTLAAKHTTVNSHIFTDRLIPVMGKSSIKSQSEITNHLTQRFKSLCQITNQIKSRCQPNDSSSRLYSICAKCHQCTSGLTVNVFAKIRDDSITEINSLTQLQ